MGIQAQCWSYWLGRLRLTVRQAGRDGVMVADAHDAVDGPCAQDMSRSVAADLLETLAREPWFAWSPDRLVLRWTGPVVTAPRPNRPLRRRARPRLDPTST